LTVEGAIAQGDNPPPRVLTGSLHDIRFVANKAQTPSPIGSRGLFKPRHPTPHSGSCFQIENLKIRQKQLPAAHAATFSAARP
jgi:hypothetical protein